MRRARNTDPATSHEAAGKLTDIATEQQRILTAFHTIGDMTDSELETYARQQHWPYAGTRYYYRRRRSDLKTLGLIKATEQRRVNVRGNTETVWTVVLDDPSHHHPVTFRRTDNEWVIEGIGLHPGTTITATTKDGEQVDVIIGEIIETVHGIDTARFTSVTTDHLPPAPVIFRKLPDGTWAVQGTNLSPGKIVSVTTKKGYTRTVRITNILDTSGGLITAQFEWLTPAHTDVVTFVKDPNTDRYLIRGTGLIPGTTVPVVKKSGQRTRVVVDRIISEQTTYQLATFTWAHKHTPDGDQ